MRVQFRPTQAVGVLAALVVAAIVISVTVLVWQLRNRELEHSRLETVSLTQMLMEQTQQNFDSADLVLLAINERLSDAYGKQLELDSLPVHLLLSARISGLPQVKGIFVLDAKGTAINSSRTYPTERQSAADREYFKALVQDPSKRLYIDAPVRSRLDNNWTLNISRALLDAKGQLRGVIVAAISIPQFELIYNIAKLDYVRPVSLYLADGTLVAGMPHRENLIGSRPPELTKEVLPLKDNEVRTIRHVSGNGGQEIFAIGRIARYPLLIGVTDDEVLSLASWRETAVPIVLGAMLVSIFAVSVALYLIRKLQNKEELAQALRAANDRYQHTIQSVMDAIVAVDESMNILLFNPAAERMFGLAQGDAIGKSLDLLIPPRLRTDHLQHVERFNVSSADSHTMAPQLQVTGVRSDGQEFPIESTVSKSMIGDKLQMTAVLRDVTQQRRAESELRELNRQLSSLSVSLQDVREQERTRLARELHDELGQQLTGLKLSLSWLGSRLKEGRSTTPDMVDDMRHLLDTAIASVRRISSELRPLILDDLGFGEAVAWQTLEFTRRSGLAIELQLDAADLVQGDAMATALFRIVQESLTNVVRHAQASQVKICLIRMQERMLLTITDNGKGLQLDPDHKGIGLVSMRERAHSIGAQFKISSVAGAGTTIEVSVPVADNAPQGGTS